MLGLLVGVGVLMIDPIIWGVVVASVLLTRIYMPFWPSVIVAAVGASLVTELLLISINPGHVFGARILTILIVCLIEAAIVRRLVGPVRPKPDDKEPPLPSG